MLTNKLISQQKAKPKQEQFIDKIKAYQLNNRKKNRKGKGRLFFQYQNFTVNIFPMLYRHQTTSQVKCNFCLEWMSLAGSINFKINLCHSCLHKGCQENALKAVSPAGQTYQLYIVKQNSFSDSQYKENAIQNPLEHIQQDKIYDQLQIGQKNGIFSETNQHQNTEIKDIMVKWSILSSFINEKESLSTEETKYLKILISEKAADLKKLNCQFSVKVISPKTIQFNPSQFKYHQNQIKIASLQQNYIPESVSNFDRIQINTKIKNKQNLPSQQQNFLKEKQNPSKIKEKLSFKSPSKIGLKQRDLNKIHASHYKISQLKENNQTAKKRLNTQFLDDCTSLYQSEVKSSTFLAQGSTRSAFGSSVFSTIAKQLDSEQLKKFEQVKNKILKYLQKNYDSHPLGRLMFSIVFEAYENTSIIGKSLELISYNLGYTDLRCYLEAFDWTGIQVLKLVKTDLSDEQLKTVIDFITTNNLPIKALVLTNNKLTQASIQYLAEQELSSVKEIYLGKNRITKGKVRTQIIALQNKYSLYM